MTRIFPFRTTRGAALLVAAPFVFASCRAPMPSAEPLGTEGVVSAPNPSNEPHRNRVARKEAPRRHESEPEGEDGGAGAPKPEKEAVEGTAKEPQAKEKPAMPSKVVTNPSAFVGDYSGDDVATYHLEGLPDRIEKDPNAKLNVTVTGKDTLAFVLIDSSNGKDICTLSGKVTDTGTTIDPGQKCFEQSEEDSSTSATVTSGKASVDGKRLVFELSLDFAMTLGDHEVKGTLEYHFDGKR